MKRDGGFTLAELLVALGITVLLVLLLASVVSGTLTAWTQGRNRLDTYSYARQLLGRLSDELRGAVASPSMSGGQIEFVENSALGNVPAPTAGSAENVFFVAPYPNLGGGDLCVIAYALDSTTHELKRAFKSSDSAWSASSTQRYQTVGYTFTSADWHVIATGVQEFELQCYSQNDLTNNTTPGTTWDSESTNADMIGKTPRLIVIRLVIVDDRAAKQLASLPVGSASYLAILARSARQFTADVTLPPP